MHLSSFDYWHYYLHECGTEPGSRYFSAFCSQFVAVSSKSLNEIEPWRCTCWHLACISVLFTAALTYCVCTLCILTSEHGTVVRNLLKWIYQENVQLEQSLTLERPGIFSELVKAQIVSSPAGSTTPSFKINASVDQHRLHGCHHHFPPHLCSHNHPRRTR